MSPDLPFLLRVPSPPPNPGEEAAGLFGRRGGGA